MLVPDVRQHRRLLQWLCRARRPREAIPGSVSPILHGRWCQAQHNRHCHPRPNFFPSSNYLHHFQFVACTLQHQHHQQRGNLLGCEGLCCRFRRSCVLICPLCGPRLRRCRALPLGSGFGLLSFGFFISSMFRPINAPLVTMFRDLFFLFIIIYWSSPPTYQFDV